METDRPLISILMAVYEPRMDWFREQLDSLNSQTYPNLRLYVCDDCSPTVSFEEIKKLVSECITAFPYSIEQNDKNLGSNGTFERLTREAEGTYFAYCDQDDIWLPEKLTVLQETLEQEQAELVCSDMFIINGDGERVADSITKVRRHHVFQSGNGLARKLLVSNFVTGCTMLTKSETAKKAIPFCPYMVHDHYLALYAAEKGKLVSLKEQLINYRIHDSNQTLAMAGVFDKESYYRVRIEAQVRRMEWLWERFREDPVLLAETNNALTWAKAREKYFMGDRSAWTTMMRFRKFSPLTTLFEIVFDGAPERLFMFFIILKRRNIV